MNPFKKIKDFFTVPQHPTYAGAWSPLQLKVSLIISDIKTYIILAILIAIYALAWNIWISSICN